MTVQQKVHVPICFILLLCIAVLTLGDMVRYVLADPPAPPPGLAAPRQPTPMPDFSLPEVGGTSVRAADWQGKVVVVRFWATW